MKSLPPHARKIEDLCRDLGVDPKVCPSLLPIRALYCDTHYIATSPKTHSNQYPNIYPNPNPNPKQYPKPYPNTIAYALIVLSQYSVRTVTLDVSRIKSNLMNIARI